MSRFARDLLAMTVAATSVAAFFLVRRPELVPHEQTNPDREAQIDRDGHDDRTWRGPENPPPWPKFQDEFERPPASDSEENMEPPTPEETAARGAIEKLAFEKKLEAEPVDPSWSSAFEAQLTGLAAAGFPDTTVIASSCRSTMCRLAVRHKDLRLAEKFRLEFPGRVKGASAMRLAINVEKEALPTDDILIFREGFPPGSGGGSGIQYPKSGMKQ